MYAGIATEISTEAGVLNADRCTAVFQKPSAPASAMQVDLFKQWETYLSTTSSPNEERPDVSQIVDGSIVQLGPEITIRYHTETEPSVWPHTSDVLANDGSYDVPGLDERQKMVHNIVTHHLNRHLKGENSGQLLMIVHGQRGTGKSALLNAISRTFVENGASSLLPRTAMSGVAASIVGGQTFHS